jgi:hypothetical protein
MTRGCLGDVVVPAEVLQLVTDHAEGRYYTPKKEHLPKPRPAAATHGAQEPVAFLGAEFACPIRSATPPPPRPQSRDSRQA